MNRKYAYKVQEESIRPASWFMFLGICNNCHYSSEECTILRKIENLFNYLY